MPPGVPSGAEEEDAGEAVVVVVAAAGAGGEAMLLALLGTRARSQRGGIRRPIRGHGRTTTAEKAARGKWLAEASAPD